MLEHADENVARFDEGPSLTIESSLPGKGNVPRLPDWVIKDTNFDLVLAIKCEGWPLCAQEWITRSRCWPTQDIDELLKMVSTLSAKVRSKEPLGCHFPTQKQFWLETSRIFSIPCF